MAVWFFNDCYVRFSFADYDPKRLKNKFAHLTNNSISKHHDDYSEDVVDETMWHSDELIEHLKSLNLTRDGVPLTDPWGEVVQPRMKEIVYQSLCCAQDSVQARSASFELFGYDFMIAEDLTVYLIEVNSSPDLSYSTSTTRTLVKAMLEDMMRVVIDAERFAVQAERPKRKWGQTKVSTGRYELLEPTRRRREEKFGRVRKEAGQLALKGTAMKLRKPKRGEVRDAEDSPNVSAIAILAAVGDDAEGELDDVVGVEKHEASDDSDASEASCFSVGAQGPAPKGATLASKAFTRGGWKAPSEESPTVGSQSGEALSAGPTAGIASADDQPLVTDAELLARVRRILVSAAQSFAHSSG